MRIVLLMLTASLSAQTNATFEGMPAVKLSNGKLELTVLQRGSAFAELVMVGDPQRMNPLWEPIRLAREAGSKPTFGTSIGHFVCVDGFGGVSKEEAAAGLTGHGEAHIQTFEILKQSADMVEMKAALPILQETLTRTVRMIPGESVVYVSSRLESLLGFDRPAAWAEHATIGSPFLEPGVTAVDLPAEKSQTRPYAPGGRGMPHRLPPGQDFTWPLAPGVDGQVVNVRTAPEKTNSGDHTTSLMDRSKKYAFVTALNPAKQLIFGYVFRHEEFPWVQSWEYYPANGKLARGLEFSTQPYDVPRREAVTLSTLFGAPTYRWLPAKSTITSGFLFFYAVAPEGMNQVDDVRLENGKLAISDSKSNRTLTLSASGVF
jgi:hypothetical protein